MKEVRQKVFNLLSKNLGFIPNYGQIDEKVKFYLKDSNIQFSFTKEKIYLTLFEKKEQRIKESLNSLKIEEFSKDKKKVKGYVVTIDLVKPNSDVKLIGQKPKKEKVNYFYGSDQSKWKTNVSSFEELVYQNIWENIDLVFRQENGELKYEFIIKPGGNSEDIQLKYTGIENLAINETGNLTMDTPQGILVDKAPISYQIINGKSKSVKTDFLIHASEPDTVRYLVDKNFNKENILVIDPGIVYSTFLGGGGSYGRSIAVDVNGNAYVTGYTYSADFPVINGFDTTYNGQYDVFVTKINAAGSGIVYSTYLGGSESEYGFDIAVDEQGNSYVTGNTYSQDFPILNAFDTSLDDIFDSSDAFVTKINAEGNGIVYSTYLGGSYGDIGYGIAVDANGHTYVTGKTGSSDFPTPNGFDPSFNGVSDAFVTKISVDGSEIVYSTFLGGSGEDGGYDIAVDGNGNVYVTGYTGSSNFPTINGFDGSYNGGFDAFITKINAAGSGIIYSTFLGGTADDLGFGIAVDANNNAYVTGETKSSNFPTPNGFDTSLKGFSDAFITKINAEGSGIIYSTFLGGSADDVGYAIAVNSKGDAYVTGTTTSTDFPTPNGFDPSFNGGLDAFVTRVNANGIIYSTFLGGSGFDLGFGIDVDDNGYAYVTGETSSVDFPIQNGFDTSYNIGAFDAFVTKIDLNVAGEVPITIADLFITKTDFPNPAYVGEELTYMLTIQNKGPHIARKVVVTDILPTSVTYLLANPSQGRCNYARGVVTCNLGNLANGESATISIDVIPHEEGVIENIARVKGSIIDPNINNNTARKKTIVLEEIEE